MLIGPPHTVGAIFVPGVDLVNVFFRVSGRFLVQVDSGGVREDNNDGVAVEVITYVHCRRFSVTYRCWNYGIRPWFSS